MQVYIYLIQNLHKSVLWMEIFEHTSCTRFPHKCICKYLIIPAVPGSLVRCALHQLPVPHPHLYFTCQGISFSLIVFGDFFNLDFFSSRSLDSYLQLNKFFFIFFCFVFEKKKKKGSFFRFQVTVPKALSFILGRNILNMLNSSHFKGHLYKA